MITGNIIPITGSLKLSDDKYKNAQHDHKQNICTFNAPVKFCPFRYSENFWNSWATKKLKSFKRRTRLHPATCAQISVLHAPQFSLHSQQISQHCLFLPQCPILHPSPLALHGALVLISSMKHRVLTIDTGCANSPPDNSPTTPPAMAGVVATHM